MIPSAIWNNVLSLNDSRSAPYKSFKASPNSKGFDAFVCHADLFSPYIRPKKFFSALSLAALTAAMILSVFYLAPVRARAEGLGAVNINSVSGCILCD